MMKKLSFLGILQTHTTSNNPAAKKAPRYCGAEKPEVTLRCVTSLVRSMNYAASMIPEFEFTLKVLDDHSDPKHIKKLKDILSYATFAVEWEDLETTGVMPSILACYEYGLQKGKELVYFMQDDYLYYESCVFDMMNKGLPRPSDAFATALQVEGCGHLAPIYSGFPWLAGDQERHIFRLQTGHQAGQAVLAFEIEAK